ncbi:MAG TPA: heparan-alpha-glucosaminide N-acetyltransferase domain-containing protein [Planctomycetota bacterium]|nr:heparan-alpha-glucosaminide N-acetyltransferase domain-containing protein [Planctomycetota bacterium]
MSAEAPVVTRVEPAERLLSLDALRGFDMFWIVGAEGIVAGLKKLGDNVPVKFVANQLEHKSWQGFHFEDLIFPLFVFLAGVSMVFSLGKSLEQKGRARTIAKLFLRATLLFLVGIFYYGALKNQWPNIRLLGVLQRIALSYFFAGLIFCCFGLRGRIVACAAILLGYWALMSFVPIPVDEGIVAKHRGAPPESAIAERFDENTNLANYIDRHFLPGRRWDGKAPESQKDFATGDHDPEGILSTLPAIATCLLGVFAGMLLKSQTQTPLRKAGILLGAGALSIGAAYLWDLQFPIVKKIWTSSYVLLAGGWSLILLSVFYAVIDVWKLKKWSMPFVWIGANALAIYLSEQFFKYDEAARRFVGGDIAKKLGNWAELVQALATMGVLLLVANFFYRKKVFIRL